MVRQIPETRQKPVNVEKLIASSIRTFSKPHITNEVASFFKAGHFICKRSYFIHHAFLAAGFE
jgi:hypothetical protein